jgi:hypothetical protein
MSGGSMNYLYSVVWGITFDTYSPERKAFRKHLMLVAKALRSIEWNDSGDGDDDEVPNIMACISKTDVLKAVLDDALRVQRELNKVLQDLNERESK